MPFISNGHKFYFKKKTANEARRKGEVVRSTKLNGKIVYFIRKRSK